MIFQDAEAKKLWQKANKTIGLFDTAVISTGYDISATNLIKRSILQYNDSLDSATSLDLGLTQNGMGLVYSF